MQLLPPPLRPRLPRARSKAPSTSLYKPTAPLGARPRSTKAISAPCGYSLCSYSSPQSPIALSSSTPHSLSLDPPPLHLLLPHTPSLKSSLSPFPFAPHSTLKSSPPPPPHSLPSSLPSPFPQITSFPLLASPSPSNYLFPPPLLPTPFPQIFPHPSPQRQLRRLRLTHDLLRTLLPLDLRGYHFISQGALAHP